MGLGTGVACAPTGPWGAAAEFTGGFIIGFGSSLLNDYYNQPPPPPPPDDDGGNCDDDGGDEGGVFP